MIVSRLAVVTLIAGCLAGMALASAEKSESGPPRVAQLIAQLGDKDYAVREHAQDQLAQMGLDIYDALVEASANDDLEIASRARYLLRLLRSQWTSPSDPAEVQDLLRGYDVQPVAARLQRIRALGDQPKAAGVTPLCRLVRFEKSPQLSTWAALEVLDHLPAEASQRLKYLRTVREGIAGSRRSSAMWLLAYAKIENESKTALDEWTRLTEAEVNAVQRNPDRNHAALAAALLYHLAEAQLRSGQGEAAERTAERALGLNPGNDLVSQSAHLQVAIATQKRGQFAWAEAEYRRVVKSGGNYSVVALKALAEMFHDRGNNQAAAETLRTAVDVIGPKRGGQDDFPGRRRNDLVGRMNYFFACAAKEKGDAAAELKYIEESLRVDPDELDSLIAYYRLSEKSPDLRRKAQARIEQAASRLREQMNETPGDPSACNQFAWLIGNTGGDLDEALRCSKLSLEGDANNGAYLDTLAHIHFARGELDEAIEIQTRALEAEPHSGLLARELARFRAARDQKAAKR